MLSYNRGFPDQFYQLYEYDADNRITEARTSADGLIWNSDARYDYYRHGPLSRVQLGDAQIQSLEYAYTINGWLKAINGDALRPDMDMGGSGKAGDLSYARDVIAHALGYYDGDYDPVGHTAATHLAGPQRGLYNGNIAQQTTATAGLGNMERSYRYDQLQRLRLTGNAMVDESTMTAASPSAIYRSSYAYDPDGNISRLNRWDGAGSRIDSFSYDYGTDTADNRLLSVRDAAPATGGGDLQPGQALRANYRYDRTGNLTYDRQGHQKMEWTSFGKLRRVTDTLSGQVLRFGYDGKGNRIYKETRSLTGGAADTLHRRVVGEYYVRDEGGNILAVYEKRSSYGDTSALAAILRALKAAAPATAFDSFVVADLATESGFGGLLVADALGSTPGWCDSLSRSRAVSWYTGHASYLKGDILAATDSWMDSMRTFSATATAYNDIYSATLMMAGTPAGPASPTTALVTEALSASPAAATAFLEQYDTWLPFGATNPDWAMFGAAHTPGSYAANASSLYAAMSASGPGSWFSLITDIAGQLSSQPTSVTTGFWDAVVSSNTIFLDTALLSPTTATSWESALTSAMTYYGSPAKVGAFLDWWPGGRRWLEGVSTLSTRLNVIYAAGADSFVRAYTLRQGVRSPLGLGGVCAELGMSPGDLLSKISGSGTGIGRYFSASGSNRYLLSSAADTLRLLEHDIYGSSRIGVQQYEDPIVDTVNGMAGRDSAALARYETVQDYYDSTKTRRGLSEAVAWYGYWYGEGIGKGSREAWGHGDTSSGLTVQRVVGRRYYELSDHLGNVLATVLDRKTGILASGSTTLYDRWKADVVSATDYYPYGMEMGGRTYVYMAGVGLGTMRFGFNGQMRDDEVYGKGNLNTAKFWEYDTRTGRRWNIDPVMKDWESLYAVLSLNPIINIDPLGNHDYKVSRNGRIFPGKKTNDNTDRLIVVGDNGKVKYDKNNNPKNAFTVIDKDVMSNRTDVSSEEGNNVGWRLDFKDKTEQATKTFEFLADNTDVEYGLVTWGSSAKNITRSSLSTNYSSTEETIGSNRVMSLPKDIPGLDILEYRHNHPSDGIIPKATVGLPSLEKTGDRGVMDITLSRNKNAKFYIRESYRNTQVH